MATVHVSGRLSTAEKLEILVSGIEMWINDAKKSQNLHRKCTSVRRARDLQERAETLLKTDAALARRAS